jgi:hypothetical protein
MGPLRLAKILVSSLSRLSIVFGQSADSGTVTTTFVVSANISAARGITATNLAFGADNPGQHWDTAISTAR